MHTVQVILTFNSVFFKYLQLLFFFCKLLFLNKYYFLPLLSCQGKQGKQYFPHQI